VDEKRPSFGAGRGRRPLGRVAVGLGGVASTLVALGFAITTGEEVSRVVSLRPCKKGEVLHAVRIADSAFRLTPSSSLKKAPLPESQLVARGYETIVVCLRDPWPMVLDSVSAVVTGDVIAGDAFCATSPKPSGCFASFLALAALDGVRGSAVLAYPGRPPADPACAAERLMRAKRCFSEKKLVPASSWEKFKRLVYYVYAKTPSGSIKALYEAVEEGVSPFYVFSMPCFYEVQEDCKALRRKGPTNFKKPSRPCEGDLFEVLAELG